MSRWLRFILNNRIWVLLTLALITIGAGGVCTRAVIGSSVGKLFLGESPAWARYQVEVQRFGSDEVVLLGIDVSDPLGPTTLKKLRDAADRLLEMEEVARVDSVLRAQRIRGVTGGLQIQRWSDLAEQHPKDRHDLLKEMTADDATQGVLVAKDGSKLTVLVELVPNADRPAEQGPALVAQIESCFLEAGFPPNKLHRAGMLAVFSDVIAATQRNLQLLFPIVVFVLLLTVLSLFRGLLPVAVTMGITLVAVIWTFGLSVWMDPNVSILQSIVPIVVMIVGFSDVIHLYSAYLLELGEGLTKREAILASGQEVGRACLFTSLTTFIGFVSLSLVPTPAFRHLGLVLGFGVAVALLIAVTATPVILDLLPAPTRAHDADSRVANRVVDWIVHQSSALSRRAPKTIIVAFGLLTALSLWGVSRIHVETDMLTRLAPDSPARLDAQWFANGFAGTGTLELYIDSGKDGGALEPELVASLAALQDDIAAEAGVDQVGSLVDLMEKMHTSLGGKGRLPTTRQGFAQYLLLFEMKGGKDLDRLVDFERRRLRVGVRLRSTGIRSAWEIGQRIKAHAKRRFERSEAGIHSDSPEKAKGQVTVTVSGLSYLLGAWLGDILTGQLNGLLLSVLAIGLMMIWVVRSLRVGLWAMLPNLLPLLVLGGYVGGLWATVDSDVFAVAMLAIGIGVDDTIHFLSRYRLEANRHPDEEALRRTFQFAGRAIVMTTIILVVGLLPLCASDYFSVRIMGTLLPMCLVVALVADLLLVPAMVEVGWMSVRR
ncbi:MAG: MMPL family transporter [Myxococcales bacterium]|nr:MMPL family transporter [Myxococcales bacterium]